MARLTVGGTDKDYLFVQRPGGLIAYVSGTIRYYTAATGGTQLTGMLLDGQSVDQIPVPATGAIPEHQWPDGVTEAWADGGGPTRVRVRPGSGVAVPLIDDLDDVADSATRVAMQPAERTKLAGVATGATANATNAQLRDRGTHTGSQTASTISDLQEVVEDFVGNMLVAGGSLTLSYDDATGKVTLTGTGGDAETIRDTIGAALIGSSGVQVAVNDAADTITLTISGLTISQVSGLQSALDSKVATSALTEAVEDAVAAMLARSTHVGLSWAYDDTAGTLAATVTGGGGNSTDPEVVRDTIGVAMRVGTGLQLVVDDAGDTITISVFGLLASQISNSTTVGRALLTATDAPAARAALGIATVFAWSARTPVTGAAGSYRVRAATTLSQAVMWCETAPAGSALTVRIQRSTDAGATWTTLTTLEIAAGSTTDDIEAVTTTLNAGDRIRALCDSVGSTTAAGLVGVEVYGT